MVLSWITHSLSHSIAQSILWIDTTVEVWKDLQDRFSQGDIFYIFDLQEEIYAFKQGDVSVIDYFTQLKILWDELENFRPIPQCSCPTHYSCGALTTVKTYRHNDYVIRFLKGPNDHNFQKNVFGRGTTVQSVNNRKFGSLNDNKVYTYCGRPRHTKETCYRKHGFPPGFNFKNSSSVVINNISSDQTEDSRGFDLNEKSATQALPQRSLENSGFAFTHEQCQR
ncbi:hypothetical protein P3X46_011965 [Hevea brasiliensis]|uniref:Retrotransposon gag domain-containing protein n=1 Tax=Hevea brasiliensis TaxID=3981 RepID=A0ABQ9MCQ3_HEVBR|nr:hypothetical protein P3X46_011965 [Hevea brasiliensis]